MIQASMSRWAAVSALGFLLAACGAGGSGQDGGSDSIGATSMTQSGDAPSAAASTSSGSSAGSGNAPAGSAAGSPGTAPARAGDDPSGTFRAGTGAAVRWQGKVYQINESGNLTENGVVTPALAKTANVSAIGIVDSTLVHQGGGAWWQWTAASDWAYLGTSQPVSSAAAGAAPPSAAAPDAAPAAPPSTGPVVSTSAPPTQPPVAYRRKVPMSGPVLVPATFVGMHSHRWPGGSAAAPTYGFGTVRSLNYDPSDNLGILWYGINKADNVYDWSKMDLWVQTHHAAGRQLVYTLYGTPAWCSSNTSIRDPYNQPGGDRMPSDLTCVRKFIDALVRRYNGDGVRRIDMVEIWNEPTFTGIQYWRDSASQLAQLGRTVYQTVKAVDPGIKVLWPAFVEWYGAPTVWADNVEYGNASDGAGGTGKDWADGFAFHFYSYSTGVDSLMDNQESVRLTLSAVGKPGWQTYNTEMGFGDGYAAGLSTELKALLIRRWMILCAAYGNQFAALYSHDGSNLGYPATTPALSAAIEEVNRMLPGKTIREAGVLQDGRVFVVFGDNSTWLI